MRFALTDKSGGEDTVKDRCPVRAERHDILVIGEGNIGEREDGKLPLTLLSEFANLRDELLVGP